MKQTTFASAAWANQGKVTLRERFLAEMDDILPWKKLVRRIRPHDPKAVRGRQPHLLEIQKQVNRSRSRAQVRGEHPFRVVKPLWDFTKVRYRGIARNPARAQVAFALANLYALRRKQMPPQASWTRKLPLI